MANIAFFIYGIGDLSGGGGAERFFAEFFEKYIKTDNTKFKVYYITDKDSFLHLKKVGKFNSEKQLLFFRVFSNRFKLYLEYLQLVKFILSYSIKIIHLPLYNISYLPLLKFLNNLPFFCRPKIVINVSNCYLVPWLSDINHPKHIQTCNTYIPLFNEIDVTGYFSWYENFISFIKNNKFKKSPKTIYAINSRFSNMDKFYPDTKKNHIVFASRLDEQKRPDWFIDAIEIIFKTNPTLVSDWKFILCGTGPLRIKLIEKSKKRDVYQFIEFKIEAELQHILNHSLIYVSCQDYENFPSLTMAEAMASGNAIVARPVGQTSYFVKDSYNGKILKEDSPNGVASTLMELMSNLSETLFMGKNSVEFMNTTHTYNNFKNQIEEFWLSVIASDKHI